MCLYHWRMVRHSVQLDVYRTVKISGPEVDKTRAAWWKAQAEAIKDAMTRDGYAEELTLRRYDRDMKFASKLETE